MLLKKTQMQFLNQIDGGSISKNASKHISRFECRRCTPWPNLEKKSGPQKFKIQNLKKLAYCVNRTIVLRFEKISHYAKLQ